MSWNYFDKIYCISLDERTDRRQEAMLQFEKVGLASLVEFVIVKRHPVNCEQGILESHRLCMRKGLRANAKTIVVFEDDIVFENFNPEHLNNGIQFLKSYNHWRVLFFGCFVKGSQKTANRSVLKIKYRTLAHAYVMNRDFAQIIAQQTWKGVAFDDLLHTYKDNLYALYPCFAFQSDSRSDNQNFMLLDRFRRFCGGLKRLQKMNERFYRHKSGIIVAHVLAIGMLLYLIL